MKFKTALTGMMLAALMTVQAHAAGWTLEQNGLYKSWSPAFEMPHTPADSATQLKFTDWTNSNTSDEFPDLHETNISFAPRTGCYGTIITPYPTATNQTTGQVVTLYPKEPDANGVVWYAAILRGDSNAGTNKWTIDMWANGHSDYVREKTSKPGRVPVTYGWFWKTCTVRGYEENMPNPNPK